MSAKDATDVVIDGKIYTLSGYESEVYLQKIGNHINNKINEFRKNEGYRRLSLDMQRMLLELNLADDYYKAKKQADLLEKDIDEKDKQLYEVKHELIDMQIKLEEAHKEIDLMRQEMSDLQIMMEEAGKTSEI